MRRLSSLSERSWKPYCLLIASDSSLAEDVELLRRLLKFDAPADGVVSALLRANRGLGPRERHMLAETGCAGVSIGRGAFYNPWIFRDTQHFLKTGELRAEPGYAERVAVMRRHLDLMIDFYGEELGCRLFRKPAAWYAKRFGPAKEFKKGVTQFSTRAEFEALLMAYEKWRAPFCDEQGELLPKFRPGAMVASFMLDPDDPAVMRRESIPVPKGPVDTW